MIDLPARLKDHLVHVLSQHAEVKRAILFGSRSRGDAEDRSDIDLAVEAPDATPRQWLDLRCRLVEESETLLTVDVVRLEEATEELRKRILIEGKVLYERSENIAEPSKPGDRPEPTR